MKKRTRILAPFLLLLAAAALLASLALAADTVLEVRTPSGPVSAGSEFTAEVSLSGNPGFTSLEFTLGFDSGKLRCTGIKAGPLLAEMLKASNPAAEVGAKIAAASASNVTGDGLVATYTFVALKDLSSVELTVSGLMMANEAREPVACGVAGAAAGAMPTQTPAPSPEPTQTPPETPEPPPETPGPSGGTEETGGDAPEGPTAGETPEPIVAFTDTAGHWGEAYIAEAAAKSLFNGYPDGSFRPNAPITRAQFLTVLYRAAGSPQVEEEAPFTDLGGLSEEFRKAIAWGYAQGCINGRGDGTFDPSGSITRQEAIKVLFYREGGVSGMEMMVTAIYDSQFADSGEIASWAKPAMYWAVYKEIIGGSNVGLEPRANTTRAQMCKILLNYLKKFN